LGRADIVRQVAPRLGVPYHLLRIRRKWFSGVATERWGAADRKIPVPFRFWRYSHVEKSRAEDGDCREVLEPVGLCPRHEFARESVSKILNGRIDPSPEEKRRLPAALGEDIIQRVFKGE
jgi:hypothetical protein